MVAFSRILFLLNISIPVIISCYIHATDSGTCTMDTMDSNWRKVNMPFCGSVVTYPTCVPKSHPIPPSREFPYGRWTNHTVSKKDGWISSSWTEHVRLQIGYENNSTLAALNQDINGHIGQIVKRFEGNYDCQNAFKNMFCYINFPRCDPTKDLSYPTCRSVCENFFTACKYPKDLRRCGPTKYFNGYFAEKSISGIYFREYFPGQPWRTNKYTLTKDERPICTPATTGGSSSKYDKNFYIISILVSFLLIFTSTILT